MECIPKTKAISICDKGSRRLQQGVRSRYKAFATRLCLRAFHLQHSHRHIYPQDPTQRKAAILRYSGIVNGAIS